MDYYTQYYSQIDCKVKEEEDFKAPKEVYLRPYVNLTEKEKYLHYLFCKQFGQTDPPGSPSVTKHYKIVETMQSADSELFFALFLPEEIRFSTVIEAVPLDLRVTDPLEKVKFIKHLFCEETKEGEKPAETLVKASLQRQIFCTTQIHKDLCTQASSFILKNLHWITIWDIIFLELVLEAYRSYLCTVLRVSVEKTSTPFGYQEEAFNTLRKLVCLWTVQPYEKKSDNFLVELEKSEYNFWDLKKKYCKFHNTSYNLHTRVFPEVDKARNEFLCEDLNFEILKLFESQFERLRKLYIFDCAKRGRTLDERYFFSVRTFTLEIHRLYDKYIQRDKPIFLKYTHVYWEENRKYRRKRVESLKFLTFDLDENRKRSSASTDEPVRNSKKKAKFLN